MTVDRRDSQPPASGSLATTTRSRRRAAARTSDIVAVEGEGSWLIDVDGRRCLDLGSGIAVTNIGHCHPARGRGDRGAGRAR